jgi:hypothetical protein
MRLEINSKGKMEVFTGSYDVCFSCANKCDCPFVEALRAEVVIPRYEYIDVKKCGLFIGDEKPSEDARRGFLNSPFFKVIFEKLKQLRIFSIKATFFTH